MALSAIFKKLLNNATPGLYKVKLGDLLSDIMTKLDTVDESANNYALPEATNAVIGGVLQGVAVANAAGVTPTKAEFDALLASLRTAGVIASA